MITTTGCHFPSSYISRQKLSGDKIEPHMRPTVILRYTQTIGIHNPEIVLSHSVAPL